MGRKRLKKEILDNEDEDKTSKASKTGKFKCNECLEGFDTESKANDHIIKRHYGLARINDEMKTPFTESEIIKALIKAQKVMKVLKCLNIGCDKQFRSGLGLKMHLDLCGKSETELTTNCEICGKKLKISSITCHMKIHTSIVKPVSEDSETEEDIEEDKTEVTSRKRASAIRAKKTIRKSTKGELIISGSVSDNEHNSADDYELPEGITIETTESMSSGLKQNNEQNCKKILNVWREFIASNKDFLREVPKNQNWNNDVIVYGKVICPLKGCNQEFTTRDGLKYHYQRCGIHFKFMWKCKLCEYEANKGNKSIVLHLWAEHKELLPELTPEMYECIECVKRTIGQLTKGGRESNKRVETANCVLEFHERFYKQKSFPSLVPNIQSWVLVTEEEHSYYIPNPNPSTHLWSTLSGDKSWIRLNLFESKTTGNHINFFVGGPVWSSAWCPIPFAANNCDQFLAIASNMNWETTHTLNDTEFEGGLIQLWNVGQLGKAFDSSVKPQLALSIAHCCGMVWDMEWCPGGTTWDDITCFIPTESQVLPRLGLLAIACGDGFIRIHSIPFPQTLHNSYDNSLYYNEPIVILNPPGVGNSVNCENTICKCLSWIKSNDQHLMIGGYGSGVAAVWDLTTTCSLLIVEQNPNQTILRPLNSWMANSAAINRIKWLANSSDQFVVTCSFDRSAKLWNLKDLTVPLTVIKKGLFTAVDTHIQWNGLFLASDDCYLGFQNNVIFKDFGFFNFSPNSLMSHKSCIWDISISEWLSAAVSVDAAGEAVIFPNFQIRPEQKRKPFDRIPLYHISALPLDSVPNIKTSKSKKCKQNENKLDLVIDPKEPPLRSYTEFSSKYGLVFNDYDLSNLKAIPIDEINRIRLPTHMQYQRLSDYPLLSINRVCWNPNFPSCAWILTATQSGICRLSCVAHLNPTLTKN